MTKFQTVWKSVKFSCIRSYDSKYSEKVNGAIFLLYQTQQVRFDLINLDQQMR